MTAGEYQQFFDLPREQAPEVVVPLGLDLGRASDQASQPGAGRIRLARATRELDAETYALWRAAHSMHDERLPSIEHLAMATKLAPERAHELVAASEALRVVTEQTDDVLLLWMTTTLRPLLVTVGPPHDSGDVPVGLGDTVVDFVPPPLYDVLVRCDGDRSLTTTYTACAQANRDAGLTDLLWTDPMGMLRALWFDLPHLLGSGVAWLDYVSLDSADAPPQGTL